MNPFHPRREPLSPPQALTLLLEASTALKSKNNQLTFPVLATFNGLSELYELGQIHSLFYVERDHSALFMQTDGREGQREEGESSERSAVPVVLGTSAAPTTPVMTPTVQQKGDQRCEGRRDGDGNEVAEEEQEEKIDGIDLLLEEYDENREAYQSNLAGSPGSGRVNEDFQQFPQVVQSSSRKRKYKGFGDVSIAARRDDEKQEDFVKYYWSNKGRGTTGVKIETFDNTKDMSSAIKARAIKFTLVQRKRCQREPNQLSYDQHRHCLIKPIQNAPQLLNALKVSKGRKSEREVDFLSPDKDILSTFQPQEVPQLSTEIEQSRGSSRNVLYPQNSFETNACHSFDEVADLLSPGLEVRDGTAERAQPQRRRDPEEQYGTHPAYSERTLNRLHRNMSSAETGQSGTLMSGAGYDSHSRNYSFNPFSAHPAGGEAQHNGAPSRMKGHTGTIDIHNYGTINNYNSYNVYDTQPRAQVPEPQHFPQQNTIVNGNLMVSGTASLSHVHVKGNLIVDGEIRGKLVTEAGKADYAEWFNFLLDDQEETEDIKAGHVVQLRSPQQKITLDTSHSDCGPILVVSTSPSVAAGKPDTDDPGAFCAFLGQVPVKVHGPIACGDLLFPSGLNDGYAVSHKTHYDRNVKTQSISVNQNCKDMEPIATAIEACEEGDNTVLCFVRWQHNVKDQVLREKTKKLSYSQTLIWMTNLILLFDYLVSCTFYFSQPSHFFGEQVLLGIDLMLILLFVCRIVTLEYSVFFNSVDCFIVIIFKIFRVFAAVKNCTNILMADNDTVYFNEKQGDHTAHGADSDYLSLTSKTLFVSLIHILSSLMFLVMILNLLNNWRIAYPEESRSAKLFSTIYSRLADLVELFPNSVTNLRKKQRLKTE